MRTGARTAAGPGTYALLAAGMAVFGSGTPISKLVTRAVIAAVARSRAED